MDRLTQTVSRVLSSLSTSFPDCMGRWDDESNLVVFSSHSSNPSENTLIRESAAEGERFSQYFVTKHGENCAFFMESPIVDAVVYCLEWDCRLLFREWNRSHYSYFCLLHFTKMRIN